MDLVALPPALGNAHLLLLHLPVGLMFAALLLELWTWRDAAGRRLVQKLLAANAFFAVLTAAAGLILAAQGGYPAGPLGWHRWVGVGCAITAVLAWWLRAHRGLIAGRVGLVLLAAATIWAGHLGATLTHGDGLFVWAAPERAPVGHGGGLALVSSTPEEGNYLHPLLVRHCVECHGPEKQKGRLRLDTLAAAFAAGRSGERGVVPGDAAASEVLRRIGLPRDDEEAMPPGDHAPLSAAERAELTAWVIALAADAVDPAR